VPAALNRLAGILGRALERSAPLWPAVRQGAQWVRQAAAILNNVDGATAQTVWRRYEQWLQVLEQAEAPEALRAPVQHLLKVTRSYGEGLFHCYRIPGLPRTNNALEQTFGQVRYHERRASGRKVASPALVVDGSVRVPAALYTRAAPVTTQMLATVPHGCWRARRAELEPQHQARRQRYRFRSHPERYLAKLEQALDKLTLPS
jgi:hypothetical protein